MSDKKIAVLIGSLRKESVNRKFAHALMARAPAGLQFEIVELGDLPLYNPDLDEDAAAVPPAWTAFRARLADADGVLIVTPEYNASLPPLLKNAIDWVSRVQDTGETPGKVYRETPFAIAAASNGKLGGTRCLQALRLVLSSCRAMVVPNQLALSFADEAYDDMERLKHPGDLAALQAMLRQLVDVAQQMK